LLAAIPRLETVALMIAWQNGAGDQPVADARAQATVSQGAQMLRLAQAFDKLILQGQSAKRAIATLTEQKVSYDTRLLSALATVELDDNEKIVRAVRVQDLKHKMVVDEDVKAKTGLLLLAKGQEVSFAVIARLRSLAQTVGVVEPIRVVLPRDVAPDAVTEGGQRRVG
jgi:hypothetical protein